MLINHAVGPGTCTAYGHQIINVFSFNKNAYTHFNLIFYT